MKKIVSVGIVLTIATVGVVGCGINTRAINSKSIVASGGSGKKADFPQLVRDGMKSLRSYSLVPLYVPTIIPKPSSGTVSVRGGIVSNQYHLSFFPSTTIQQTNGTTVSTSWIAQAVGLPGSVKDTLQTFEILGGYTIPVRASGSTDYHLVVGKVMLNKGIQATTYRNILVNRNHGLFPSYTELTWQENRYHFEVSVASTTSLATDVKVANEIISGFNAASLPKPYRYGIVSVNLQSKANWAKVTWDEKVTPNRIAYYTIETQPPCQDFIFTALQMATSMRPYA
ncbi:hypothetical protein [Alicyclobacillus herbarius]|uniref:hypothetical protein n=1 Tax=Alicyclobacillus herbarius TaxID=122960 RepID=UPI0012DC0A38|nr:hypothetical protein [Alicyclobacillus herbarius]